MYAYTVCNNPNCNETIHEVPMLVLVLGLIDGFTTSFELDSAELANHQDLVKDLLDNAELSEIQHQKLEAYLAEPEQQDEEPTTQVMEQYAAVMHQPTEEAAEHHRAYQQASLESLRAQTRLTNAEAHHKELQNKEFAERFGIKG